MSSWLQSQLKAANEILEAVDRTAQKVSVVRVDKDNASAPHPLSRRQGDTLDGELEHIVCP